MRKNRARKHKVGTVCPPARGTGQPSQRSHQLDVSALESLAMNLSTCVCSRLADYGWAKAPVWHSDTQRKQSMQLSSMTLAWSLDPLLAFSMLWFGQTSAHFRQASHFSASIVTAMDKNLRVTDLNVFLYYKPFGWISSLFPNFVVSDGPQWSWRV